MQNLPAGARLVRLVEAVSYNRNGYRAHFPGGHVVHTFYEGMPRAASHGGGKYGECHDNGTGATFDGVFEEVEATSQQTGQEATAADTSYTMTDGGTVKLGATTFTVEIQDYLTTGGRTVWLTGPRGGVYFLRAYLNVKRENTGHYQVISWGKGHPYRFRGNEVTVLMLGDVIEVAK